jgi:hypothetical protein
MPRGRSLKTKIKGDKKPRSAQSKTLKKPRKLKKPRA